MSVEASEFRSTAGLFATGVAIVVTEVDSQVHAMTANAVSSLSLDPMLMMFCPSKKARLALYLVRMSQFTLNFLRHDQQALSSYFAGASKHAPTPPPFRFVPSAAGPRLEGALASIGCRTEQVQEAGDHWIVIGRVICLHRGVQPRRPLVFFAGEYRAVDFAHGTPAPDLSQVEDEPPHVFYQH